MFKKFIALTSAVLGMASATYAQQPCGTDEHYHSLLQQYPHLADLEKQFESQLKGAGWKTTAAPDTTTYDIPFVVHVIHDYGVENISDNIIYDAVKYWSIVYTKQNPDTAAVISPFVPHIGNPKMRLHLATKDPNGNPTKGVVRQMSYLATAGGDQAKYEQWPNNKYINIYLVNKFDDDHAGAAAYAYYPSAGASMPFYDGVICLYNYVNYDKTIPHELGHVLNLPHVWGSTNSAGVACGDDGVDDTPPTKGHTPVGCTPTALYDVTCIPAGGYKKTYVRPSTGVSDSVVDYPDTTNAQNIMDYTYCELMFTNQQCTRMRNALTSSVAGRNNLITAANLNATGALDPMPDLPPVADYVVAKGVPNSSIMEARTYFLTYDNAASFAFKNASWNDTITSVNWSFSNSATTPTISSMGTVTNKFGVPGWVTASVTATSNAGSHTLVNTHAVYAADPTPVGGIGYYQEFSSPSSVDNWPMFNYYNNQFKWEYYTGAGYGDNSCVRFRSYDTSSRIFGTAVGDYDDFITPAFNLAGITDNLYFNFFTAGASTNKGIGGWTTKVNDSLEIWASTTGGAKWTKIGSYRGTQLVSSGPAKSSEYLLPGATEWIARAVSVPGTMRSANTFFRFRYRPGNTGNNLYLDKVYVYPFPAEVKDALAAGNTFAVYPNPAENGCRIAFKVGNDGLVNYVVKDLTGKVVCQASKTYPAGSMQQEEISRATTQAAGMYFITVTIDGVQATQKLVVY
jgi:hypothetical protein